MPSIIPPDLITVFNRHKVIIFEEVRAASSGFDLLISLTPLINWLRYFPGQINIYHVGLPTLPGNRAYRLSDLQPQTFIGRKAALDLLQDARILLNSFYANVNLYGIVSPETDPFLHLPELSAETFIRDKKLLAKYGEIKARGFFPPGGLETILRGSLIDDNAQQNNQKYAENIERIHRQRPDALAIIILYKIDSAVVNVKSLLAAKGYRNLGLFTLDTLEQGDLELQDLGDQNYLLRFNGRANPIKDDFSSVIRPGEIFPPHRVRRRPLLRPNCGIIPEI